MWFKIFKKLTQPGMLIFLALIALLISLGLQLAVTMGALSLAVLSAAAPVLLGIFLSLMVAATVAAVGWGIYYFYHDYQEEKRLDEEIKKILNKLPPDLSASDISLEFNEEVGISPEISEINKDVLQKLARDYGVVSSDQSPKDFSKLLKEKRDEILNTKFSYRKAFFNACKDWFKANQKAIIIAGVLLVALMIILIVFSSLSLAGAPVPFFIGALLNGMVGFFELGFVGLGWTAPSAFAAHHLVASVLAGITFCLGPVNIISTFRNLGSALHDIGLSIRKSIEKSFTANPNEDVPLPPLIPSNSKDNEKRVENSNSSDVLKKPVESKTTLKVDDNLKPGCVIS